ESDVPVIMLTARTTEEEKLLGLGGGADDYVTKPFSPRELVARVHAVLRRTQPGAATRAHLRFGPVCLDAVRREVRVGDRPARLTPSEFKLLLVLARHPGRMLTREELVTLALGVDYDGLARTIDVHIMKLRKKLDIPGRPPLIE